MSDLVREAATNGITDYGVTDHIHTPFNRPDLERSRLEFDGIASHPRFHFGVEASCVSRWEIDEIARGHHDNPVYGLRTGGKPGCELAIALSPLDIASLRIEYVVGGTHWPMYVPMERRAVIRDYHRQNMFLAMHPLVDIVAHPWWWHGGWEDAQHSFSAEPWFDDFACIPESMHQEFASAAIQHGKKIEINLHAMLLNPHYPERFKRQYVEYLAGLKARGVTLSLGSDCHDEHYVVGFERSAKMLDSVGITHDDLWVLPPRAS
jgi:histidinol phosphatase-like PHP family hydrolase